MLEATAAPIDARPQAAATGSVAPGSWRRAWRVGTIYWLICHAAYAGIVLMAARFVRIEGPPGSTFAGELIRSLVRWDGTNYVTIADNGYPADPHPVFRQYDESTLPVWPPGFPILIRLASFVLPGDTAIAAIIVANVATLGMLVVLYRLVEHELGADNAQRTLVCLLAFPTAFFLAVPYAESVFLLLTFASLYLARRGHWWYAGLAGGVASSVRVLGVTLALALAYEYLRQREFVQPGERFLKRLQWRRIRFDVLSIALVPTGLFAYMAYLWYRYDNPMLFRDAQVIWGRGPMKMPWTTLADTLAGIGPGNAHKEVIIIIDLATLAVATAMLILCFVGPWRLPRNQLYLVLAGAVPLILAILQPTGDPDGHPLMSVDRYVLSCFPIFLVMARIAANRHVERLILFAGLPLQAALMILYMQELWAG